MEIFILFPITFSLIVPSKNQPKQCIRLKSSWLFGVRLTPFWRIYPAQVGNKVMELVFD
ncbi:MAG: hypothetical protein HRT55_02660 [Colwellia sp.]|uniref:hypothetical protein n=1 Tax=Colwellia sp. TaxID=56799 RepID=UPI0025BA4A7E|nr:hypothetical protein [Colwellia sp.]NQZ25195.1 hypothetical protein [Colwellia sp.]